MSQTATVAITTVLGILVVANILGNSTVCWIIKKHRDMRMPIHYLLVNLAVADIMFAVFIIPSIISSLFFAVPDGLPGAVLCKLLIGGNFAWFESGSSTVTLTVIAIERYYAVIYPLNNTGKRLTKRKLKVIIAGSWMFALVQNVPLFLARTTPKEGNLCLDIWPEKWMGQAYALSLLVVVVLSCGIMVVLYSRAVYTLWLKSSDRNQLNYQQRGVARVRKRVTLMVIAVSVIFGICYITETVEYALRHLISYRGGTIQNAITNIMVLFNSTVNPFIYALVNKQFRDKMKRMMCFSERDQPTKDLRSLRSTRLACNSPAPRAGLCSRK